jgi:hypothetical protein
MQSGISFPSNDKASSLSLYHRCCRKVHPRSCRRGVQWRRYIDECFGPQMLPQSSSEILSTRGAMEKISMNALVHRCSRKVHPRSCRRGVQWRRCKNGFKHPIHVVGNKRWTNLAGKGGSGISSTKDHFEKRKRYVIRS